MIVKKKSVCININRINNNINGMAWHGMALH